ncbi:unnamed protein product [Adineta steineri]|uniref:Uncharacterized protein n=1 Tax=Adineta steineri TaxID=433720 RepID=A0A813TTH8_9BILA|nr:unnamed protein product [Adineta steineri]
MTKEIIQQLSHLHKIIHQLNIRQSDYTSEVTKEYGYLKFDENEFDSTTRLSQYIRLALQTNAKTVVEFLQHGWCLPTPDLIISVIGGGKQCNISAHLRKIFQRGLVAAAATTNAWLITSGTNVGIAKEVGEALSNYRYKNRKHGLDVPCIGICTWDYTAGNQQLQCQHIETPSPDDADLNKTIDLLKHKRRSRTESIQMDMVEDKYIRSYSVKHLDGKHYDLEPNHTHFLLFDGNSSNVDTVLVQRAQIEKYLRRMDMQTSIGNTLIPTVMILAEGGPFSIQTICEALQSNTPLVVVKGSGRAADLVADLHLFFSQIETNKYEIKQIYRTRLSSSNEDDLNSVFEKNKNNKNKWIDDVKDNLCQVLYERMQLVVIFEFDSHRHHGNLEEAILEALINAAKFSGDNQDEHQSRVAELKLAMAWQKFDYAQKHILTDATITEWKESDLCQALIDALRRDYVDFVELLMDYGSPLEKLTLNNLEQLYASSNIDNGLPIENKDKHLSIRNNYYSCYFPNQFQTNGIILNKDQPLGQNARREFFLWAIFLDRYELARYLCSKTWNQSVASLIAAQIYRQAITMALHSETKEHYENNASQFDRDALFIIDRCFDHDEYFAVDLLKQPAVAFDNVQPLKLAEQARCRAFLASKCVQKYLDEKWYGHINYKRPAISLQIFFCSLFIPLIPIFCVFLPYVHEHPQIIRNNKNRSKSRNPIMIRTALISDRDPTDEPIQWSKKLIYFYQAPIVRFFYNVIFLVLFLGLFSSVLLIDFLPLNIHYGQQSNTKNLPLPITEIILHVCVWTLIMEELRLFILMEYHKYISDMWNLINVAAIILYLIAFITRFIPNETFFIISKIFLNLDLIVWFVGTLHLFAAFERLGPKLVMIFNTMKDLFFFVCFILIFLCGFSITSWSLITSASQVHWIYSDDGQLVNVTVSMHRNNSWTWKLIRDITHYGVWKVFGQVDPIAGTDSYSNMAFILAIVFVAIANILLLNVLIALFNVTVQNVQEQSHDLWRYQRFLIVNEYSRKTLLPPPFNILYYIFIIIQYLLTRFRLYRSRLAAEMLLEDIKTMNSNNPQQFKISDSIRRESAIAEDYWQSIFKHKKHDQTEIILQNIEQK